MVSLYYNVSNVGVNKIPSKAVVVSSSTSLVKSRKQTDSKLDYSHITVELRTVDGLVKDRTQCAPNGYYFIPVYDKGSFVLQINDPEGRAINIAISRLKEKLDDSAYKILADYQTATVTLLALMSASVDDEESCSADRIRTKRELLESMMQDLKGLVLNSKN